MTKKSLLIDGTKIARYRKKADFKSTDDFTEEMGVFRAVGGASYSEILREREKYQKFIDLLVEFLPFDSEEELIPYYDLYRGTIYVSQGWLKKVESHTQVSVLEIKARSFALACNISLDDLLPEVDSVELGPIESEQVTGDEDKLFILAALTASTKIPLNKKELAQFDQITTDYMHQMMDVSDKIKIDKIMSQLPGGGDSRNSGGAAEAIDLLGRFLFKKDRSYIESPTPELFILMASLFKCAPSSLLEEGSELQNQLQIIESTMEDPATLFLT